MKKLKNPLLLLAAAALMLACSSSSDKVVEGFQVEPGFSLELVASEPLVVDPVDLIFDEEGAAYVLEMPGYPLEDKQSRVRLLLDTNNDGQYDSAVLFAENLQMASSLMAYRGGLLVAAPPYLLFLRDKDRDHRAEAVDTLMGGFSTGNLQHNYNGLNWGVDNYIYAVNGGNSGSPFWWPDSSKRINIRGNDFRFRFNWADGKIKPGEMELVGASSHGYELGMDVWGRMYETHNMEHISHLVFPDRYRKGTRLVTDQGLDIISDHEEMGTARIYPIGEQESRVNHPEQSGYFSGSCGVCVYDGGAFGPEYDNTVWVADVVLNLLHVDKLQADGATLKASRVLEGRDFLASTDRSFRPVNLTVGPDGGLYVLDIHRKVIEHPEWIPDDIEKTLDLNAGKDQGRIFRLTSTKAKGQPFDPGQLADPLKRVDALSHANQWVARTAHRKLIEDNITDEQVVKLNQLIQSGKPEARVRALWVLQGTGRLDAATVETALADPSTGVRENALILAESFVGQRPQMADKLLALLKDSDQRVRMQAALSVSVLPEQIFKGKSAAIMDALAATLDNAADQWNIAATTLAARRDPAGLFDRVAARKASSAGNDLMISLALVATADQQQAAAVLHRLAAANADTKTQQLILEQFVKNIPAAFRNSSWESDFATLEKGNDPGVVASLAALRNRFGFIPSPAFAALSKDALVRLADTSLPDSVRASQFSLIALMPFRQTSEALYACLANTQSLKIQEGALRLLAEQEDKSIGQRLVKMWPDIGPQARKHVSDLLLYKEVHHDALLTGLENKTINIGEMNFDLERRRQLLWWTDNMTTRSRAEKLFSDSGVTTRKEAFETASAALKLHGDAVNGVKVFTNTCSSCHRFGDVGQEVGPVLTEISRKSKESILHEIVDPNSAVDPRYINHRVDTREGKVYTGIVDKETDEYVTLRRLGGESVTVNKRDITRFVSLGTSLMMEGLETGMSQQELADLLAYLTNN